MVHELLGVASGRVSLAHVVGVSDDLKEVVMSPTQDEFYAQPRCITQADRLLNTLAPLMDKTHTTHSPLFKTITASAAARLPLLYMPPKRPAISPSVAKKTRKSLTLEVKLDIIHRHERVKKTNSIASHHGLTPSTVYHFQVSKLY
ncbi:Vacuolar protein sorting-associated protein 45 [Portunus trituberculatus]|uniref:Vacuolar protein sorting-associated protein 45 n=1 Tax=Portunus trituberculatus TaxID=210409 RepID=A0A5B7JZ44_PORTR|nr:Vacuolar protein sorting-associated protein 45 [Portunus trituberculatus]